MINDIFTLFIFLVQFAIAGFVVIGLVLIFQWVKNLRSQTLEIKARMKTEDAGTMEAGKNYDTMDLSQIFLEARIYHSEVQENIVKEKNRITFKDEIKHKKVEIRKAPQYKLFPGGSGFQRELLIRAHEDHRLTLGQLNESLAFILRVLKQKGVIEIERGDVIAGDAPTEFKFRFFNQEDIANESSRQLKDTAGLYKVVEINARKETIYPEITRAKNGDILVLVPETVVFTEAEILRAVPRLKAYYNEDFDTNKVKRSGNTFIIRKKIPVSNYLTGTKAVKVINDKGEETVKNEPKTILDRWDDWEKDFGSPLKKEFLKGMSPKWYLGRNQDDDGSGITDMFLETFRYAHWLIVGTTGSGKTETAKSMLFHRLYQNPDTLIMYFDGKKADTFRLMAEYTSPYPLLLPREDLPQELYELYFGINKFYQEYLRRQKLFQGKAEDIDTYNRKFPNERLNDWILVMEEWGAIASTFLSENDLKKPTPGSPADQLMVMLRGARSYGLQLIFLSQSGKDNEVPNVLKELTQKLVHRGDKTFVGYFDCPEAEQLEPGQYIYVSEFGKIKMRNLYIGKTDLSDIFSKGGFKQVPSKEKIQLDYDEIFLTTSGGDFTIQDKAKFLKKFLRDEGFSVAKYADNPETADVFMVVEKGGHQISWMYLTAPFFNNQEILDRLGGEKVLKKKNEYGTEVSSAFEAINMIVYEGELPEGKERKMNEDKLAGVLPLTTFVINKSRFNRMLEQATENSTKGIKDPIFTNRIAKMIDEIEMGDGNQDEDFDKVEAPAPPKARKSKKTE